MWSFVCLCFAMSKTQDLWNSIEAAGQPLVVPPWVSASSGASTHHWSGFLLWMQADRRASCNVKKAGVKRGQTNRLNPCTQIPLAKLFWMPLVRYFHHPNLTMVDSLKRQPLRIFPRIFIRLLANPLRIPSSIPTQASWSSVRRS